MERKRPKPIEKTAYHEAGHAVAGYLLHRRFAYVTIVPDEEDGTLGHILYGGFGEDFHPDYDDSPSIRMKLERAIMCALAGGIAEGIFSGRRNHRGASGDYASIVNYTLYITHSIEEAEAYIAWLSVRTREMLKGDVAWALVEALAAALLEQKHIGYRKARGIIKQRQEDYFNNWMAARPPLPPELLARLNDQMQAIHAGGEVTTEPNVQ